MRVRAKITALGAAGVLAALPTSASAQAEPGFTADPQSPAGVEYAIPLDQARGHGGGGGGGGGVHPGGTGGGSGGSGSGSSQAGGSSPALFGAGITPPSRSKSNHHAAAPDSKRGGSHARAKPSIPSGSRAAAPVVASADYSSTGPVVGIVAAILLAGALLGLFLHRRGDSRRTLS
jgi:hypothetical protein